MPAVLLIDDLPETSTEAELREMLGDIGPIAFLKDSSQYVAESQARRGFIVEMATEEATAAALSLNGNGISVSLFLDGSASLLSV